LEIHRNERAHFMTKRLFATLLAGLLACLPLLSACAQNAAPVEGDDYVVIAEGQPWQPLAGKIEVVEVFGYWCHVCDDFQPLVDDWKKKLPKDVRFSYVPAAFSPTDAYARAYFAAESLGALGKTHHATFRAIHDQQSLPQRNASIDEIAAFYDTLGVDAARLRATAQSPATDTKMAAAREFAVRSGVQGTPTLVVNGIYRVQAKSLQDMLRIADALIAKERAASKNR
jgi:thiol:disulfide interchange protein DsbA